MARGDLTDEEWDVIAGLLPSERGRKSRPSSPRALLADKGYDGDAVHENLLMQGILPIIPSRSNRREPIHCDFRCYRDRNRIERMLGHLKQFRRIAARYDKTALGVAAAFAQGRLRQGIPIGAASELPGTVPAGMMPIGSLRPARCRASTTCRRS